MAKKKGGKKGKRTGGRRGAKNSASKAQATGVIQDEGGLGELKARAAAYGLSEATLALLAEEGMELDDLEGLGAEELVEIGVDSAQAPLLVSAVRGDPIPGASGSGPLPKLRAAAEAHGITQASIDALAGEELDDDDLEGLEVDDLEGMGLDADQAARVLRAVRGEAPPAAGRLAKLKARADEFKISADAVKVLDGEELDDDDLAELSKDDLKDLGIKLGQALRIIKAVKAIQAATKQGGEAADAKSTDAKSNDDNAAPAKTLTKAQLKRQRRKEREMAAAAAAAAGRPVPDAAAAAAPATNVPVDLSKIDPSKLTKAQKKKLKAKQKKAAEKARKAEEERKKKAEAAARLKALKEAQAEAARKEKERIAAEKKAREDAIREAKEAEERAEAARLARIAEKKRRRLEKKKSGVILTKKQREQKRKLELARQKLLAQQAARGGDKGDATREGAAAEPARRDINRLKRRDGSRKKPKSKKLQAFQEAQERAKREKAAAEKKAAAAAAAEEVAASDDGDGDGGGGWDDDGDDDAGSGGGGGWDDDGGDDDGGGGWDADDGDADDGDDMDDAWDADVDEEERERREKAAAEKKKAAEEKARAEAEAAERKRAEEERKRAEALAAKERKAAEKKSADNRSGKGRKGAGRRKKKDTRELRSPICCILGHVDTGKTKLLDKMRSTNVQDREAGGITQQIGATYFPMSNIEAATNSLVQLTGKALNAKVPGLLMIDTPGHESFTNLRARGSNLCDIAILVVDIMHALEPQTLESIRLLKERKTPFIVALNKVDRLHEWKSTPNNPIKDSLKKQQPDVLHEFERRVNQTIAAFAAEAHLNTVLYYKNKDPKNWISLVPTSAHTGEGIPDLLWLLVKMTQTFMRDRIAVSYTDLQCTVLEVKKVEGLGTTIDVVLVNGRLKEGDTIVVCGLQGPIATTIRALLTPPPMREIRVKADYVHHKEIKAAMGVKISAQGLDNAIAGTQLLVCGPRDDIEELKDECMSDLQSIYSRIDPSGQGVHVQASTLGSLEALLAFLEEQKVPVAGLSIGPVHKKDVMKAAVMRERREEFAVILAFDVEASAEAKQMANEMGVTIFTAEIIYHLFEKVTKYFEEIREKRRAEAAPKAVFPCLVKILPEHIYNKRNPIVIGVEVTDGILRKGTPLCVPTKRPILEIGQVVSIQNEHKEQNEAKKGDQVCIKIEQTRGNQILLLGRQFTAEDQLVSRLTRESIKLLKENFQNDLEKEDWMLVVKLKRVFGIFGSSG